MTESTKPVVDAVPKRSQLKEWAYDALRDAIVDLRLRPGDALREARLSEDMGISKTPLREALVRLEADGLVDIRPYRGAVVRGYTNRDLSEIYELRELLEGSCARRAASAMSEADLKRFRRNVDDSEAALEQGAVERLTSLFDAFDSLLFAQTDNERIRSQLQILRFHIVRIGRLNVGIEGRPGRSVREHRLVCEAISERDPERAERAIREHVRSVVADHLAALDDASAAHGAAAV